ncbi:hypothetical protein SprV_0301164500 [Sparganum proliferum]
MAISGFLAGFGQSYQPQKTTTALAASKFPNETTVYCDYWWIQDYSLIYVDNLCEAPKEFALLGTVSFCLTLLNIILIIITGYSVNWLKDLVPKSFTNEETRIFYTKDLKAIRDNYKCVHKLEATDLASQAYHEYLRLSRVYPENGDLLALTEEENEQLTNDFRAVMEGIGKDRHLQNISTWTSKGKDPFMSNFVRATEDIVERRASRKSLAVPGDDDSWRSSPHVLPSNLPRHLSVPVTRLEADFRTLQSRVNPLPTSSDTTLGGSAASKRLEKLKHLAEVESARYQEEEDEREGVIGAPLPEGYRRASLYPGLFLRNAWPRSHKHQHLRRSMAEQAGQGRRMTRPGDRAFEKRQSIPSAGVTTSTTIVGTDGETATPMAMTSGVSRSGGIGDQGHLRDHPDNSGRPGGDVRFLSPASHKPEALSTISSSGTYRSSEVPSSTAIHPSTRGAYGEWESRKPPISHSAYDLRSHAQKYRKSSSVSSVSTIGGKFEVTPTIDIEHKSQGRGATPPTPGPSQT